MPILYIVAILPAARFVELVGAEADLVYEFEVLWFARYGRWQFLWGICVHGGDSSVSSAHMDDYRRVCFGKRSIPAQSDLGTATMN
jgi:hypothetical protein